MPGIKLKSEHRSGWGEGGAETLGLLRLCAWGWPLSPNQRPFCCFSPKGFSLNACTCQRTVEWRAAFCVYYSMPEYWNQHIYGYLPGCTSQLLTWECRLVSGELLKAHTPQPDPVFLPSASESSTPIYANVDPPARAPQTDRKETTGKAPLYTGIGPVDESGIAVDIRVSECCSRMLIFCFHIYTVQLRINIILWHYCVHFCHALKLEKQIIKQIIFSLTVSINGGIFINIKNSSTSMSILTTAFYSILWGKLQFYSKITTSLACINVLLYVS